VSDQPTNDVSALRGLLFDTLRDLRDKEKPMEVDRARAISDVAKVLVDSARVEVEHMKLTGGDGSGFIPEQPKQITGPTNANTPRLVRGKDMRG
jgi:hypothetical protein